MSRHFFLVALLGMAACQKPTLPPGLRTQPSEAGGALEPAPSAKLDPRDLDRYVAYEKNLLAVLSKQLAAYKKTMAAMSHSAGKPSAGAQSVAGAAKLAAEIDADMSRLQKQSGLSAQEIRAWDELTAEVTAVQSANGKGALAEMAAKAHARAEKLPPKERARAEEQLAGVDAQLAKQKSLVDQRAEFGNAAVDAVQKRARELAALREQRLTLLHAMTAAAGDSNAARP